MTTPDPLDNLSGLCGKQLHQRSRATVRPKRSVRGTTVLECIPCAAAAYEARKAAGYYAKVSGKPRAPRAPRAPRPLTEAQRESKRRADKIRHAWSGAYRAWGSFIALPDATRARVLAEFRAAPEVVSPAAARERAIAEKHRLIAEARARSAQAAS